MNSYRVVVVGCGGMANAWVENVKEREACEIVALVDIKAEFAQAMAECHGLSCNVYTDIEEAIRANNANLVLDITVPASHFLVASTALRNGCDVLGEKPMAATMAEARTLVQIAEDAGKSLSVMQNRRYNANIRAFRELIQ